MESFLLTQILPNLPTWFSPVFKKSQRLCLPYMLSIRDIDDILRAASTDILNFHVEIVGQETEKRRVKSALELSNLIHDYVFHNAPAEAIISFEGSDIWLYFDGEQRFSTLLGDEDSIRKAFAHNVETMKWYFIIQTDDMFLSEELKIEIFDAVTSI